VAQPSADYEPGDDDGGEPERCAVRNLLSPTPVSIDEIIRQSGLPSATVQTVLLELELGGQVERHAGGKVSSPG
jgi:DNA processing protein